ncbi:uncharacterized protein UV8b_04098 [Ustilaginoidea virens]|uniref:Uncharacterized protein n=1 Tax=Ustilaginoidea virens TaxID=1159556 RepID=A0A063CB15_USTVR|nr:uncharacterized protein UV8b_04098 [Ustilaginoidea virens]QUC19857.1 hypothetical protein UV8b_04098 [Ustilaginoidea virens]GAO14859.1 hypothetical protein UVI_02005840 [Ustilaginoidea virens]
MRHYGTVNTADQPPSPEPAQLKPSSNALGRPLANSTSGTKPSSSDAFARAQRYVPSVLLPREAACSPTVHKIHVLGEDARSKFIAHALSSVYDSVEMIGWKTRPFSSPSESSKYGNIEKTRPGSRRTTSVVARNLAAREDAPAQSDGPDIHQLVVTGYGYEAAKALETVKDRLDDNATVCLMNDGLGVLEDVRTRIFQGAHEAPNFLLGHMSHRLAFNRRYDAVARLRGGQTRLTYAEAPRVRLEDAQKVESRPNFVRSLARAKDLKSSFNTYDQWLRFKLPAVIFDSVVEPVCVLLDMPYHGLLQNRAAQRTMYRLLREILLVLEDMPELKNSTVIRDYLHSQGVQKFLYNRIMSKRSNPSQLVRRIQHGLPTDVEYLNGYFIRRGRSLGINLPMNVMMRDMIKAKHSQSIEQLNSYIPVEETSVPSHLAFQYRTTRG